jgi:hypothetical protein
MTAGTPVAGAFAAAPLPMPSTLAADASPEFRVVAEALVAAMQAHQIPGAAIGLLTGDRLAPSSPTTIPPLPSRGG